MCDPLKERWHVGDRCIAPFPENGKLCEATITSLETDENGRCFAVASFRGSQEQKISIVKLCRIKTAPQKSFLFDDEDLEKPYFPDIRLSSPAVAFELSIDGDYIPCTINRYLRDYQREGALFLYGHYVHNRGCILGDDMGLGKTIQVISFLAAVLNKKGTRADIENNMPEFLLRTIKKEVPSVPKNTFLIVTPLSVLYNWKEELDTWGYFRVIVLYGSRKDYELSRIKQGKCEIVLTTYKTLHQCLDELNSLKWSAVIVDEVHRIKNPKAQVTKTMKMLTCNIRIGLTGTILQNNMKELWCVMDWAVPGLLGSEARFKKEFSDPVEHGQRHTATKRELATGRKAMQRLAQKMHAYFLRRTKSLINNQLPRKEDRMVYCSLTEFQRAVYKTVLETEDVQLILQAQEPCSCNSGRKRKNCCYKTNVHGETMQALYFSYLTILRKIANHAALLQTDNTSKQQEAHITSVCNQVFLKFPDFMQLRKDAAFETISDPKYSGKMKVLQKLLNHFRKNKDKVLLFSFSTKLLDVLEQYCMASGLDYQRLDGNTKAEDRVKIVKEFNSMEEVNICLVSTMAGGVGLNFTGANIVILFDPTWNPANDLQAIDRVYRIGQSRDVKVFRLISLGTVEEIMYLRQVYKQQLHCVVVGSENAKRYFEAVQGSKDHQGELFGINNLFRLQDHGSCLTKEILEREGRVEAGVMTATMWLKEEPQEHKQMSAECGYEDEDTVSSKEQLKNEALIYSSNLSDEEMPMGDSKAKADQNRPCSAKKAKISEGQLTLLQCGFSKLLEKGIEGDEDGSSIGASEDESGDSKTVRQRTKRGSKNYVDLKHQDHCTIFRHEKMSASPSRSAKQEIFTETDHIYQVAPDSEEKRGIGSKYKDKNISNRVEIVMETEDSSSTESEDVIFSSLALCKEETGVNREGVRIDTENANTEKSPLLTTWQKHFTSEKKHSKVSLFSKIKSLKSIQKKTSMKEKSDVSDESEDIEMSLQPISGKQKAMKQKHFHAKELDNPSRIVLHGNSASMGGSNADSQNIEEFSSPEDNVAIRKVDANNQRVKSNRCSIHFESRLARYDNRTSVTLRKRTNSNLSQNSFSKQTFTRQGEKRGSLDSLLGDVAEVSYIHSNQNVVGSSKAENQMSRWAVRDVFELQQFSQLPANVAVCSPKKNRIQNSEQVISRWKSVRKHHSVSETSSPSLLYVTHPVYQKEKMVHRVGLFTFLIGKTPKRIRRRQFEEMVSHFCVTSMDEFAKHIVKATSEERQKMLKEFYGTKYPELKDLLKIDVPEGNVEGGVCPTQSKKRKSVNKDGRSKSGPSDAQVSLCRTVDLCGQKRHKIETNQFPYDPCIHAVICHKAEDKQLPTVITQDSISERNSQAFKDFMASDSLSNKSGRIEGLPANTTEGQLNLKGTESPRKSFLSQSENRQTQICKKNSSTDVLGDTSILNDLFKSNGNRPREPPKSFLSGCVEKAKTQPKDFWDMLNEQNEDSLQKLTDLSTIEKLCERAPHVILSKKKEEEEKSLWKKNDNFLWKKCNPNDFDN
ncbi:DNA excision repair protein ERCC-6-like 2 [Heteronotia binoei]|uniref:DNA excision repair protein ERCC-6-like 2 n=1 Tax=Heteronotia binoei TaxID=13085 RepID=UPI00292EA956|nr:DNA excision repair protein ERCC-6-like 2 [Heteronotia binoei]